MVTSFSSGFYYPPMPPGFHYGMGSQTFAPGAALPYLELPPPVRSVGQDIAHAARNAYGRSSRHGPDQGNLACAFMVNEILQEAIGKKYGSDPDTVTSVREDILRQGGKIVLPSEVKPGDIAFTFNENARHGEGGATAHIGIVLTPDSILSNSSSRRCFDNLEDFKTFGTKYPNFEIIRVPEALNVPNHDWDA